ncbi:hypothetical protein V1478_013508 [Vespula squamosa]|uniref:Uncharacterized protein n=1 Tax=Vespula squamosa TaxID=30214 RepID=A0ABD2AB19_VESSQ
MDDQDVAEAEAEAEGEGEDGDDVDDILVHVRDSLHSKRYYEALGQSNQLDDFGRILYELINDEREKRKALRSAVKRGRCIEIISVNSYKQELL